MAFGRNETSSIPNNEKNPRQIIQPELDRDEKLIWADTPISVKRFGLASVPIMLFGVPFFAFSVFWTWSAANIGNSFPGGIDLIFPLFGIPFMLVGLGMLLSPLWKMYKAKHFTYGLTNKRLIIREGFPGIKIQSWPLSEISSLSRNGTAKGPGDVIFAEVEKTGSKGRRYTQKIGFIGISEPKRLEEKIRNLMKLMGPDPK